MCCSAGNSQRPGSVDMYRATITIYLLARQACQFVAPNPRFNSRGRRWQRVADVQPIVALASSCNVSHGVTQPVGDGGQFSPVSERQRVLANGCVCVFPEGYDHVRHLISHVEGIGSEEGGRATKFNFVILEAVNRVPGTAEVVRCNIGLGIRVKPFQHGVDEIPEFCLKFLPFDSLIPLVEEFDAGVLGFVPSPRHIHPP